MRSRRRRYLALMVVSDFSLKKKDLAGAIWNALIQLFGEYGASQTDLRVLEYDHEKGQGIVRCSHDSLEMLRASIASITEVLGRPTVIQVLGVSGTIRSLRKRVRY